MKQIIKWLKSLLINKKVVKTKTTTHKANRSSINVQENNAIPYPPGGTTRRPK